MNEFFLTPMTCSYAEDLKNRNNGGNAPTADRRADDAGFADTVIEKIEAAKEERRGKRDSAGCKNDRRRTDTAKKREEKRLQEKRAKRHKLYMDLALKAWYKRENEREYQENIAMQRKELSSALLRQRSLERATGEKAELGANPSVLSQAAADFAQGYVFFKIPSALHNPKPKSV